MAPATRPETVLKQAEGLVSVGQTHAALQSLTEMFSSKKFRSTPLTSLEPIMHRFVELCVEMRKGRTAKEGLMQYKNIAQNTSVQSIENVITRFVELADKKVREAQEKAAIKVALDVDDLEASETPESILLGAVSGDQSKDRTDRALVTPWLKFLWESYRTSLETLKNNARLETIYQQIAQQAFKFCLKYQRKVEFRRLCETLRLHLANVGKYSHQPHSINLSDADTLQHHLDTRFAQLNTSVELELWQEAFRSVEDVHNLLTMAKKAPRPAMMAGYYEKLTKIFLMSGNALYHAAAWSRYYAVVSTIGGKSSEEMSRLAAQVLVSALAVPVGLHTEDELKGKNARLSALLGLTKMPSRSGLLKDALSRDVLRLSPNSVKSLYNILEVTFDPLSLCSSIAPLFHELSEDASYSPYLTLLQRALLSRLLSQLSQVYSTVKIAQLHELIAPLKESSADDNSTFDEVQVEAYVMGCARRGELSIRVDHAAGSITFVDDAFSSNEEASTSSAASGSSWESTVQPSAAELVRTRLSSIATCLHNSLLVIEPRPPALTAEQQQEKVKSLVTVAQTERKALQVRRALVARRRELLSELTVRKEKEETSRRAEIARREKEEDERRLREEARKKERERTQREIESIRAEEAKKLALAMVERGQLKGVDVDNMQNLDQENLISIQVAQIEKEKKEMTERLRVVSKRLDHIERAYRKDERPLLDKDYEEQQNNDRETFMSVQKSVKETAKHTHEENLEAKGRLTRMLADYKARKVALIAKKEQEYAKRMEAASRKVEEEKSKRKKMVLLRWEEEKKKQEEEERMRREEEEEQARLEEERRAEEERLRAEEEDARAAAEAKKREEEEKLAAIRKAREEERAKADEQARLQRQREDEAEARRAARAAEKASLAVRKPVFAAARENNKEDAGVWRRSTTTNNNNSTPFASTRSSTIPPARPESPAGGAAPVKRYVPGALRAQREAAGGSAPSPISRSSAVVSGGSRPSSPAPARDDKVEEDGFQKVEKKVWKPRQLR
ncbi:translation initiation factor 3 subunit A [Pleurotus pulmonarius]